MEKKTKVEEYEAVLHAKTGFPMFLIHSFVDVLARHNVDLDQPEDLLLNEYRQILRITDNY